jgi:hypothetical protein
MKLARFSGMGFLLLLGLANPVQADEAYFMLVFASQRPVNLPRHTHTFATFVKATWNGPQCASPQFQAWTISWMPQTLLIELYRLRSECGINLDLHSTLRWAREDDQRISLWGPYQIQKELFDRALGQIVHLQSGTVTYKAVVTGFPPDRVSNCSHAVGDLVPDSRTHLGVRSWGDSASYFVTLSLAPWIIDSRRTHDWILPRLGLADCPLIRRGLNRIPTRNPILRSWQRVAHPILIRNRDQLP